ncbi:MAG: hypothetical protein PHN88_04545 [Ignavibacteria bacterium]|nr:hypothetical protein [Ignavibacteria bacterium]
MSKERDVYLETLGIFITQNCYLTYTSIGSIADHLGDETYETELILEAIKSNEQMITVAFHQLQKLLDSNTLSYADKEYVQELNSIYTLLYHQAKSCIEYIESEGNPDIADIFESYRLQAWDKIEGLAKQSS